MKIVSLLENTAFCSDMLVEHGLSLYIQTDKYNILFDMGASDLFAINAKKLGIDLVKVDFAVVSHGHSDHGGGLNTFLQLNKTAKVYVQRSAFNAHYNAEGSFIGLDKSLMSNPRIVMVDDEFDFGDGITLRSCNDLPRYAPMMDFGFTCDCGQSRAKDTFDHEQHLVIKDNGKTVVISGCTHKGIEEIVRWFNPNVVVGGFHYAKITDFEWLQDMAKTLDFFSTIFYTCHCTGIEQYEHMKKFMSRLNYIACGQIITI